MMKERLKYKYFRYLGNCILFCLFLVLTSCFSFREEYPEIHYYRLSPLANTNEIIGSGTIEGTLQIRNFSSSEAIESTHFQGIGEGNEVKVYYYHRWISNIADLLTDFMLTRYNSLSAFTGSVVKPGSILVPDYILEGQLIEMSAYNSKKTNYVIVSVRISLVKKVTLSTDKPILLNKVFTVQSPRQNSSVETIAPAFSVAVNQLSDKILLEIQDAIAKDRRVNNN